MKLAVEKAILEAAPEIERIEVRGISEVSKAVSKATPPEPSSSAEWVTLDRPPNFNVRKSCRCRISRASNILLCRFGDRLYAYENLCPSCGAH